MGYSPWCHEELDTTEHSTGCAIYDHREATHGKQTTMKKSIPQASSNSSVEQQNPRRPHPSLGFGHVASIQKRD